MKTIKFRAWDGDRKRMETFFLNEGSNYQSSSWEIMQYTGLKDAGNRELYDGDFFRDEDGMLFLISWDEDSLQWHAHDVVNNSWSMSLGEFVGQNIFYEGNLYENKELLK